MGWFDGDSSDDDDDRETMGKNGTRASPASLMLHVTSSTTAPTTTSPTSQPHKNDTDGLKDTENKGDEEDDPLDAYMKSLANPPLSSSSTVSTGPHHLSKTKMARLDVENEDEATSHWTEVTRTNNNSNGDGDDHATTSHFNPEGNNLDAWETSASARAALDSTFHKAGSTSTSTSTHSNVDITLTPIHHETMNYAKIKKCLITIENNGSLSSSSRTHDTSAGHAWRQEHQVTCHPPIDPVLEYDLLSSLSSSSSSTEPSPSSSSSSSFSYRSILPDSFPRWCQKQSYTSLTPVQAQTLPVAFHGYNSIITAATGSGKTLSYLWPLVVHLYHNDVTTKGLILSPTRELTLQIEKTASSLGKAVLPLQQGQKASLAITGGGGTGDAASNKGRYFLSQTLYHSNPRILVATPGRLLDVLRALPKKQKEGGNGASSAAAFTLQDVTFLVLDEADKLLQMGFSNQVIQVLQQIRPDRQCLMTSATMGHRMEQVAMKWMGTSSSSSSNKDSINMASNTHSKNLVRISVGTTGRASEHVDQHVVVLPTTHAKEQFVLELLPSLVAVGRTLIFVATRDGCEQLATTLRNQIADPSLVLETLHGDKHQSDRNAALQAFKKGRVLVLIATDVAGRGLDIPSVTTVLNFDPAKNLDTHVHRIGRAGRLSKDHDGQACAGTAYTLLLSPGQADFARVLKSAQEREGRPVSAELAKLAQQSSSRAGSSGGYDNHHQSHSTKHGDHRNKNRPWGLGFSHERPSESATILPGTVSSSPSTSSYYGPASSSLSSDAEPPAKKKSRWG
jgi:ATP-dependent RNA helicase DDX42